ncbi:MAG: Lrp/AsnC family transcriptional regulator [Candidatus Thermoplasmatota archaeon]|jgi:Lrp/AsnC family transcriptional regulator of lysine biosynthesis|nr:Lrp/AsnC family transcriptional regulator [Candidatus Thermoplasmatota archaeon]
MEHSTDKGLNKPDDKDIQILNILKKNSRLTNTEIARMLNFSEGTVRKRINKLLETGTIRRFTIELGRSYKEAIILIKYKHSEKLTVLSQLNEIPGNTYEISGKNDLAMFVEFYNLEYLNDIVDRIRSLEYVMDTETLIRLK